MAVRPLKEPQSMDTVGLAVHSSQCVRSPSLISPAFDRSCRRLYFGNGDGIVRFGRGRGLEAEAMAQRMSSAYECAQLGVTLKRLSLR